MSDLIVVEQLLAYLIDQGVGQRKRTDNEDGSHTEIPPSLTLPSIWLPTRKGFPEPRPGENATITLSDALLTPPASLEAFIEETFIDVMVRSRQAAPGKLIHRQIRGLLHPVDAHGGRKGWEMSGLHVEYSTIWRSEQELGASEVCYDRMASYRFGARRTVLAGT